MHVVCCGVGTHLIWCGVVMLVQWCGVGARSVVRYGNPADVLRYGNPNAVMRYCSPCDVVRYGNPCGVVRYGNPCGVVHCSLAERSWFVCCARNVCTFDIACVCRHIGLKECTHKHNPMAEQRLVPADVAVVAAVCRAYNSEQ